LRRECPPKGLSGLSRAFGAITYHIYITKLYIYIYIYIYIKIYKIYIYI
jgi:hypothetical protein